MRGAPPRVPADSQSRRVPAHGLGALRPRPVTRSPPKQRAPTGVGPCAPHGAARTHRQRSGRCGRLGRGLKERDGRFGSRGPRISALWEHRGVAKIAAPKHASRRLTPPPPPPLRRATRRGRQRGEGAVLAHVPLPRRAGPRQARLRHQRGAPPRTRNNSPAIIARAAIIAGRPAVVITYDNCCNNCCK